jgi:GTPase SAR1 family protein
MGSCSSKTTVIEGFIIRIGLLGDSVSGKSAILSRFTHNSFSLNYQHNTKNHVGIKSYLLEESFSPVTVEVWEVQSALSVHIDIAIIVADSTKPISDLQDYYWKWLQIAQSYGWNKVYIALSKIDIKGLDESYAEKVHEALVLDQEQEVYLTSSLTGKGIDAMLKSLITHRLRMR